MLSRALRGTLGRNGSDAAVVLIGDIHHAGAANRGIIRNIQFRTGRCAPVAGIPASAVSRERCDDTGRGGHLADPVVKAIGNVDVSGAVDREASGLLQLSTGCGSTVATISTNTVAGNPRDDASRGCYLADDVSGYIGDVDVSGSIYGHSIWGVEFRARRRATISAVTRCSVACDSGNNSGGYLNLANARVVAIGNIDIPRTIPLCQHQ
jgi:hypothetical protein